MPKIRVDARITSDARGRNNPFHHRATTRHAVCLLRGMPGSSKLPKRKCCPSDTGRSPTEHWRIWQIQHRDGAKRRRNKEAIRNTHRLMRRATPMRRMRAEEPRQHCDGLPRENKRDVLGVGKEAVHGCWRPSPSDASHRPRSSRQRGSLAELGLTPLMGPARRLKCHPPSGKASTRSGACERNWGWGTTRKSQDE